MDPKSELKALMAKNSAIIAGLKSTGRDLTDAEVADLEKDAARIIELKGVIARADAAGANLAKAAGAPFEANAEGQDGGYITPAAIKSMVHSAAPGASKALVAGGSSTTPVALDTNPIKLATPDSALGLLGVLKVTVRNTPKYSYLRQTVRTNAAAVVAPGAQKPTSVYTVESVDGSLEVVAHLSEYVDTYLLADNSNLETFLDSELRAGIFQKVTALAVAKIQDTAGISTQAFTTNAMDSIYLGASKASGLGYAPDTLLIAREDFDALALAKDSDGNYLYKRGEDSRLHGLNPVIVTGLDEGTALVIDSSRVGLSTDALGIQTKWDAISKMDYNQVRALVEGRFSTDVYAAPAIVQVEVVDPE